MQEGLDEASEEEIKKARKKAEDKLFDIFNKAMGRPRGFYRFINISSETTDSAQDTFKTILEGFVSRSGKDLSKVKVIELIDKEKDTLIHHDFFITGDVNGDISLYYILGRFASGYEGAGPNGLKEVYDYMSKHPTITHVKSELDSRIIKFYLRKIPITEKIIKGPIERRFLTEIGLLE